MVVKRKGGPLTGSTLSAELQDKIAEGAVGEAELAGDSGHGTPVQKEGTQGLVLTVLGLAGSRKNCSQRRSSMTGPPKCHTFLGRIDAKMVARKRLARQEKRRFLRA